MAFHLATMVDALVYHEDTKDTKGTKLLSNEKLRDLRDLRGFVMEGREKRGVAHDEDLSKSRCPQ